MPLILLKTEKKNLIYEILDKKSILERRQQQRKHSARQLLLFCQTSLVKCGNFTLRATIVLLKRLRILREVFVQERRTTYHENKVKQH